MSLALCKRGSREWLFHHNHGQQPEGAVPNQPGAETEAKMAHTPCTPRAGYCGAGSRVERLRSPAGLRPTLGALSLGHTGDLAGLGDPGAIPARSGARTAGSAWPILTSGLRTAQSGTGLFPIVPSFAYTMQERGFEYN